MKFTFAPSFRGGLVAAHRWFYSNSKNTKKAPLSVGASHPTFLFDENPRGQAEGADRLACFIEGRRTMSTKWTFVRAVFPLPKVCGTLGRFFTSKAGYLFSLKYNTIILNCRGRESLLPLFGGWLHRHIFADLAQILKIVFLAFRLMSGDILIHLFRDLLGFRSIRRNTFTHHLAMLFDSSTSIFPLTFKVVMRCTGLRIRPMQPLRGFGLRFRNERDAHVVSKR